MSSFTRLLRILPVVAVLGAVIGSAQAATQSVAPVTLPKGNHGVDGPFFPNKRTAAVLPSTGTQLQQQAQQRIDARMGGNSVLSNGASITKAQAQSSGLGFIAKHFDQIDTARSGRVSLNDVKQYLQQQQSQ
ncbi:2-oxoglutarate dehydrogenase [Paraburkholderia sp. C35]|uniref:2-oxoglutarate dehydrogenase n=1 Tax=Paraburkholderia sp. C35 TaxID=2126993 RepID=UPI000D69E253|nr:2-oxoglutarate dehydrogenase [Paraburkholderia sp. C35]